METRLALSSLTYFKKAIILHLLREYKVIPRISETFGSCLLDINHLTKVKENVLLDENILIN